MIPVGEASERILSAISPLPSHEVPLDQALGLVLAEPVVSRTTSPPWDNSSMDGYAVNSADLVDSKELKVVGVIAAGALPERPLGPGEAMRIMTGAPIPLGADSVIRIEDTDGGTDRVTVHDLRDLQRNIRKAGEDFSEGSTILDAGNDIRAAQLGVIASAGVRAVRVHRRPRVALITSGDELVDLRNFSESDKGRRIVSSNSWTLPALVRDAGGQPIDFGIASDDRTSLREKLEEATGCDLIITSAGMSVGDADNVRDVFTELGGEIAFWKVRMRPGAPMAFGKLNDIPWLGFSGNPVSAMVSFEVFGRAAIRKMLGHERLHRGLIPVRLGESVKIAATLTHFLRVRIDRDNTGEFVARLAGSQSSSVLTAMARANALLIVPAECRTNPTGTILNALPLSDDLFTANRLGIQ